MSALTSGKNQQPLLALLLLLFLSGLGGGCSSMPQYTTDYKQARMQQQGMLLDEQSAGQLANRFVATFNKLGSPDFIPAAKKLYAQQFFLNDTLSQYRSQASILSHFEGMNQRVTRSKVQLVQVTYAADVAYVHWHMRYDLKFMGKVKSMDSYGISELKQNAAGQIIFQQDFWDPANGLFRALPYVGGFYQWILPFKNPASR